MTVAGMTIEEAVITWQQREWRLRVGDSGRFGGVRAASAAPGG